jgi:hypothetical protein
VAPGDALSIAGIDVAVSGGVHTCIHTDLPESDNNGYFVNDAILHPGDALSPPSGSVDVLLVPVAGPCMKFSDGVDYLRAVAPVSPSRSIRRVWLRCTRSCTTGY